MIRTTDTASALEFCAAATRLGLGLEVTAEGSGIYALSTRNWDEGAALWRLVTLDYPANVRPARITHAALAEEMDHLTRMAELARA